MGPFAFSRRNLPNSCWFWCWLITTRGSRVGWLQRVVLPGLIVLPGLLLILKQPDLGSGLSFLAVYAAMLLMVGVRSKALGIILLFSVMLFPFVWEMVWGSLHDYQRQRIMAFVDPDYDPGGKGYHALQSRIAIGSGELAGKGLYGGTQSQLKFLPEGHTDFVFAVYAEEWGFVGVLLLLLLFMALIWVSLEIAARRKITWVPYCGRHCGDVVFLRGGQYRNDGGHVSYRGNPAAVDELWRQRDHYDHGLIGIAVECETTAVESVLLTGRDWAACMRPG